MATGTAQEMTARPTTTYISAGERESRTKSPPIVEKKFETSVETWFLVMSHRRVTRVYVIVHEFGQ